MSTVESDGKTIVIRDRRKPNQFTTDNVIAREWLPILRVGDAFFFYSVYLSMANRETESSWGSLRTMAEYLQCGVDLVIRGNKLLEICELIHIETGNQHTTNEYYILDPPSLSPELEARIRRRLKEIRAQESSVNWQSWVKQVRKALDKHHSLSSIWARRRANKGGRPVIHKASEREMPTSKGVRESQAGCAAQTDDPATQPAEKGACEPQAGCAWDTSRLLVSHKQGVRESQPEQEQLTRDTKHGEKEEEADLSFAQARCRQLGISLTVLDSLFERYPPERILCQLEWLPSRQPRDPTAMLVSAVQGDWAKPARYDSVRPVSIQVEGLLSVGPAPGANPGAVDVENSEMTGTPLPVDVDMDVDTGEKEFALPGTDQDAREIWTRVLKELRMQMTRAAFDTWLGGSRVIHAQEGVITVRVRDEYAVEWLRTRWNTPIQRTLSGIAGRPVNVHFEVA